MSVELNIPQDLAGAAALAASPESQVSSIDVGLYEENHFLLRVYIGFDAQRVNLATREMRDRFGKAAYAITVLKALPQSETVRYFLTLDGIQVEVEAFTCMLENAGSLGMGEFSLAPDVSIQDGLLDIFCMHSFDFGSMKSAASSIAGKRYDSDQFHHWRAKEITIDCDPPQPVIGDGEDWGQTPITVKVLPGAIDIITPASY
ncbi:diacylglycerol/lipid kinase family protein [Chloroflexota bacterium]